MTIGGGIHLTAKQRTDLEETANLLATRGKGITACDESAGTIGKRFEAVEIDNTEENRRLYRQMLFTAPGSEEYICGAILDPETLLQKSNDGILFPEVLSKRGIVTGVKPHLKVYTLPGTGGDTVMQGLDSLAVRCREYYAAGARFAKWRSPLVIDVANGRPTDLAIKSNMSDLARYALICQSEGLLPVVELQLDEMGKLYIEELKMASAAATGNLQCSAESGSHKGTGNIVDETASDEEGGATKRRRVEK